VRRRDPQEEFLARRPIPGVTFEHDDYVRVTAGPHKGERGNLVNVFELGSDPVYILESESSGDIHVRQSEIERDGS
jgi:ribosomal protein L24